MAARILHSLTDDNPDLQKQIGCMNGIFQLFDRQPILTAGAGNTRIVGHRLNPGNAHFSSGPLDTNSHPKSASPQDKYPTKNTHDRHRVSTESSIASFSSSSRSSSFSSFDCNRGTQLEPATYDRIIFPETPSRDPTMSLQSTSPQFNRQSLDLKDLVKDSMYREIQGLSVKSKPTDQAKDPNQKHRNSPRQHSKYIDGDFKESLKSLHKLQETSCYQNEPKELSRSLSYHSRDGSALSVSKDVPRLSYDGREINRTPFDSSDVSKSSLKFKDLPRLSLDSREGSIRSINSDSKSNNPTRTIQRDVPEFNVKIQNQARPPSVVAKLMGLDTLPDSISDINTGSSRSFLEDDLVSIPNLFAKTNTNKPAQLLNLSSNVWKDPSSPSWRNPNMSMKPMLRFPVEPAPWQQSDGTRGGQKPALKNARSSVKANNTVSSVYSEIEKRLKDLKFTQSGKDLRALKQILEAMQEKDFLEPGREGQGSNNLTHYEHDQELLSSGLNSRFVSKPKPQSDRVPSPINRRVSSVRNYDSPIVIMKPAKLVEKSGIPVASVIPLDGFRKSRGKEFLDDKKSSDVKPGQMDNALDSVNTKAGRTVNTIHNSTKSLNLAKDSNAGLRKNSNSTSPGLLQEKLEMDKRARPPTPPDSSKSRKQSNKQQPESFSPGGRRRSNYLRPKASADELNIELSDHENEKSLRRAESVVRKSKIANGSPGRSHTQSSKKVYEVPVPGLDEKNTGMVLSEEESAESAHVAEYSSPVSVLDNLVHKDDLRSPVKYAGKSLQVDVPIEKHSDSNQGSSIYDIVHSTESSSSSEINQRKLQNIGNLVQKLRRLNSNHDEERTDYIASLCDNADPSHRYISEILLASGLLLRDLSSSLSNFQFHQSGHPINPELFLVLEQTKSTSLLKEKFNTEKATAQLMNNEKYHRKLIFDSINEILARKLACSGAVKVLTRPINGQKLLRDLCSEIDGLQPKNLECNSEEEDDRWKQILCKDVMDHNSGSWINFVDEISDAVLDIERMVFKDLITEVIGEPACMVIKTGKRRLQPHATMLRKVKDLFMAESWREAQRLLRRSSSLLKQDIYTIILTKPSEKRPSLRRLYSDLFNAVTRLDYAARDEDRISACECYESTVLYLDDILSRL